MTSEPFRLVYDGPALRDGSMDVRDLSHALLALGDVAARANFLLNGERSTISLRINAQAEPGSFPAALDLFQTVHEGLFNQQVIPPQVILEYLGLAAASVAGQPGAIDNLIELWKLLKGSRPDVVEERKEAGVAVLEVNGENHTVNQTVLNLYGDRVIHNHYPEIVAPVRRPGIEEFRAEHRGQLVERVDKKEAKDFSTGRWVSEDVESEEREDEVTAEIITAHFREGYKWRFFSNLLGRFTAEMKDEDYLARLQRREEHPEYGDSFRMRIRSRTTVDDEGPSVEREIVEVLEIFHAPRQRPLQ